MSSDEIVQKLTHAMELQTENNELVRKVVFKLVVDVQLLKIDVRQLRGELTDEQADQLRGEVEAMRLAELASSDQLDARMDQLREQNKKDRGE